MDKVSSFLFVVMIFVILKELNLCLGHFYVLSIQIGFTCVVFPCLILGYMGQAAYLIKHPSSAERIFYDSVPNGLFWPVFVIATLAAVIASQGGFMVCNLRILIFLTRALSVFHRGINITVS